MFLQFLSAVWSGKGDGVSVSPVTILAARLGDSLAGSSGNTERSASEALCQDGDELATLRKQSLSIRDSDVFLVNVADLELALR